jgi:PIN domain nuclease of toxin-antitoxin system
MTILLDTHTLLWFLENDPQLPASIRIRIQTSTTVFVSIVSLWEIAIKTNVGKLSLPIPFSQLQPELTKQNITQLTVTFSDLEIYYGLPLHHRDPFDRLLISQAINYNLTFISRDTKFNPYLIQQVWD